MIRVFVAGIGMTQFGKSSKSLVELLCEAALRALSATTVDDVDAIYIGVMNPEEFTGDGNLASRVAEGLNMTGIPATRVETATSAGTTSSGRPTVRSRSTAAAPTRSTSSATTRSSAGRRSARSAAGESSGC
jgi:acetyl-CoA acetyltransferase